MSEHRRTVQFRMFRSTLKTWEDMFSEAAEFASMLGTKRLISISHSADSNDGVIVVWYWATDDDPNAARTGQDSNFYLKTLREMTT